MRSNRYKIIVIGSSAGGFKALSSIFSRLPASFPIPIIVAQHLYPKENVFFTERLNKKTDLQVKEAEDKERIKPGIVYFAPANYHILIEHNDSLSLSVDAKVNFSRPSIDVLFESAVYTGCPAVIGIILTGANADGSAGIKLIKKYGGTAIVQTPETSYCPAMPMAAIQNADIDYILPVEEIAAVLIKLAGSIE